MNDRRKYISEEEEDRICLECDWVACRVGKKGCGLLAAYHRIRDAVEGGRPSAPVGRPALPVSSKAAGVCILPNCTDPAEEGGLCASCRRAAEICGIAVAPAASPVPPPVAEETVKLQASIRDLESALVSSQKAHQEAVREKSDLTGKVKQMETALAAVPKQEEGVILRFTGSSEPIMRKLIDVCAAAGTDPAEEFAQLLDDLESGRMYLVQRKQNKKLRRVA